MHEAASPGATTGRDTTGAARDGRDGPRPRPVAAPGGGRAPDPPAGAPAGGPAERRRRDSSQALLATKITPPRVRRDILPALPPPGAPRRRHCARPLPGLLAAGFRQDDAAGRLGRHEQPGRSPGSRWTRTTTIRSASGATSSPRSAGSVRARRRARSICWTTGSTPGDAGGAQDGRPPGEARGDRADQRAGRARRRADAGARRLPRDRLAAGPRRRGLPARPPPTRLASGDRRAQRPAAALADLRARGRLAELRAADLRFTRRRGGRVPAATSGT